MPLPRRLVSLPAVMILFLLMIAPNAAATLYGPYWLYSSSDAPSETATSSGASCYSTPTVTNCGVCALYSPLPGFVLDQWKNRSSGQGTDGEIVGCASSGATSGSGTGNATVDYQLNASRGFVWTNATALYSFNVYGFIKATAGAFVTEGYCATATEPTSSRAIVSMTTDLFAQSGNVLLATKRAVVWDSGATSCTTTGGAGWILSSIAFGASGNGAKHLAYQATLTHNGVYKVTLAIDCVEYVNTGSATPTAADGACDLYPYADIYGEMTDVVISS